VHLERDQRAVALADRRGADEFAAGNVGEARLRDPHDHEILRERDVHALAAVGLDGQVGAVDSFHRAPDPHRRIGGGLRDGGGGYCGNQQCGDSAEHGISFGGNKAQTREARDLFRLYYRNVARGSEMTPRPALLLLFLSLGLLGCSGSRYATVRVPPEVETRTAASVWSNSSWATKQLGGVHVSSD